jgi:hypothetical protein
VDDGGYVRGHLQAAQQRGRSRRRRLIRVS